MLQRLIGMKLDSVERELGESVEYMRYVLAHSRRAFFKFMKVIPVSEYRRALPADACHVARLAATRDADCGPCVQIEINAAKKDGIAPEIIKAAALGRPEDLSEELAIVFRFADSIVQGHSDEADENEDELREIIRERYGDEALIEMSMAIALCRIFPTMKRGLGYATSCRKYDFTLEPSSALGADAGRQLSSA